jgi:molybdopterin/thiamine biosynthesis adenylyltransferase
LQKFRSRTIGIAGLGATGKQVATILSVMGHKEVWGADPDKIEMKNVGTQGWSMDDIGYYKSEVLQSALSSRRSSFIGLPRKFEDIGSYLSVEGYDPLKAAKVFFCCVDTMQARTAIWGRLRQEGLLQGPKLWVDSRLASRVIRVITIPLADEKLRQYYESTLYSDIEAFQGACTDRMTYYGAGIAAGLMVSQLVNWLNYGMVPAVDFTIETASMVVTRIK